MNFQYKYFSVQILLPPMLTLSFIHCSDYLRSFIMLLEVHPTFLFLPYFDFFLPTHCRRRKLLSPSITLSGKHKRSVGLLWTRDRPVAEIYTWKNKIRKREKHLCCSAGFEPATPTGERPQTYVLDRASAIAL